jgi:hypothetical protein
MDLRFPVVGCMLALGLAGQSLAQLACPTGSTRVTQVQQLVGGNTLCAMRNTDRWQEFHQGNSSGPLIDFKLGPTNPVDPTETVGAWSAQNGANSSLTHTYTGGSSFTWLVCQVTPTTYTLVSFGSAGTITGATIRAGQGACPGS